MRLALSAAVLVLVFAAASPASASSVRTAPPSPPTTVDGYIYFTAAAGEANDVTIRQTTGGFQVSDLGAPLSAGSGCTAVNAHSAVCNPGVIVPIIMADLGDMDDRLTLLGPAIGEGTLISGGPGNDTLSGGCQMNGGPGNDVLNACNNQWSYTLGGPGDDVLNGGTGADSLQGGGGHDVLNGGPGDDVLASGDTEAAHDADVFDGGPGTDEVIERDRTGRVTVDLSNPAAQQGEAGEGDSIRNVENATTGSEPDTITGNDGPNRLLAGGGDDVIRGLGGDDVIVDGWGADRVDGGPGNDRFESADLFVDHINCGPGMDRVALGDARDVRKSCESVHGLPSKFRLLPTRVAMRPNRKAQLMVGCFNLGPGSYWEWEWDSCAGTLTIHVKLGRRSVVAGRGVCPPPGTRCPIYTVPISKPVARLLRQRRSLHVTATYVRWPGARHGAVTYRQKLLLKLARPR